MTTDMFAKWDPWWWYREVLASIVAIHDDDEVSLVHRCIDMICTEEPRFILLREFVAGATKSERPEK
jgi:hypothetical protein